ncbi:MAG: hypothetical protein R3C03_11100 [Pirellulaceae bacterium]
MQPRLLRPLFGLIVFVLAVPGWAQNVEHTADVRFEFDLNTLRHSPLIESIGIEDAFGPAFENMPASAAILAKSANRIWGVVSLPESDDAAIQAVMQQRLPVEFVVFLEMQDADSKKPFLEQFTEHGEIDGDTGFYRINEPGAPSDFRVGELNDTTVMLGSVAYISNHKQFETLATTQLDETWARTADSTLKIAVDVSNKGELMKGLQTKALDEAPMEARGFLMLIEKIKNVNMSLGFSGNQILDLQVSGATKAKPRTFSMASKRFWDWRKWGHQWALLICRMKPPKWLRWFPQS